MYIEGNLVNSITTFLATVMNDRVKDSVATPVIARHLIWFDKIKLG